MKTRVLLSIALGLFCMEGLARGKLKPRTSVGVKSEVSAFKAEIPLNPSRACSVGCVQLAQEALNPRGVRMLNELSSLEKGDFMSALPSVYEEMVTFYVDDGRGVKLSLGPMSETSSRIATAKEEARGGATAIASAVNKSVSDKWPQTARDNLSEFVMGLTDGISEAEAKKLREVKENCI